MGLRDSHGEKAAGPEALRESEERYREVFLHSNDATLVIDPDRDAIMDANPRPASCSPSPETSC